MQESNLNLMRKSNHTCSWNKPYSNAENSHNLNQIVTNLISEITQSVSIETYLLIISSPHLQSFKMKVSNKYFYAA